MKAVETGRQMPFSREAAGTGGRTGDRPHRPRHLTRRARLTAAGAFITAVIGGLVLAGACGGHPAHDDPRDGRAPLGRQAPHSPPSPRPGPPWNTHPRSIAAVGDSITRGFDACSLLADCPAVSWATGTDRRVDSLARRLVGGDPTGRSWNHAVSGAVMADLPAQMERAAAHDPDLVTVLAGANDACRRTPAQMTPVADFRAGFREALHTLRADRPEAEVYVSSVPDLRRLWSLVRLDPVGEQVWRLGICQSMLRDPESMSKAAQARRRAVYERVTAYNSVLAQECARVTRCRYDGGAVFRYRFGVSDLSHWDWFHPGRTGQRKLAELAYEQITAARPPRG